MAQVFSRDGLITFIVFVVLALGLKIALTPSAKEANAAGKVAGVHAAMRSLATGLEAYYVDNNRYPDWTSLTGSRNWTGKDGMGHINAFAGRASGAASIHSFRVWTAKPSNRSEGAANQFHTLTTPIAYLIRLPTDESADTKGATYGYFATDKQYIIISSGFDDDASPNALGHIGDIDPALEATDLLDIETGLPTVYLDGASSPPTLTQLAGPGPSWSTAHGTGAFTYDPTNGTFSQGDIWRMRN